MTTFSMPRIFLYLSIAICLVGPGVAQDRSQGRSMVISRNGIVAAESPLAAQAGARILERGGNAVDAAIATNANGWTVNGSPTNATTGNPCNMPINGTVCAGSSPPPNKLGRIDIAVATSAMIQLVFWASSLAPLGWAIASPTPSAIVVVAIAVQGS